MRARLLAIGVSACAAWALTAGALGSGCVNIEEQNTLEDVPFDGSFLGACKAGATKTINASECPAACSGTKAVATCVGTSYGECSCLSATTATCDSGCCAAPHYTPTPCTGMVAITDPSEEQCDAANGYLLCNGTCFSTFVCELPSDYTVVVDAGEEGGADAGVDAGHDASRDATGDVVLDAPRDARSDGATPEAGKDGGGDAATDGGPKDAAPTDAKKGHHDA